MLILSRAPAGSVTHLLNLRNCFYCAMLIICCPALISPDSQLSLLSVWTQTPLQPLLICSGFPSNPAALWDRRRKEALITHSSADRLLVAVQGSAGSRRRSGRTSAAPPPRILGCLTPAPERSACPGPGRGRRRAGWGLCPGAGWWCHWWTPSCCPAPSRSAR